MQDLLRAGINVITTVNIQHFESLYNIVEDVTGVKVKELPQNSSGFLLRQETTFLRVHLCLSDGLFS